MERDTELARGRLPPLDRSTIRAYEDAVPGPYYYQRVAHPVGVEAERVMARLEGVDDGAPQGAENGGSLLFPSGAGATTAAILALLAPGSARVAVARGGYWGTVGLMRGELARWGVEVTLFDQTGPPPPDVDLVWLEPCANPTLTFPDLASSIRGAHAQGALVLVDNTVLSPWGLRPLEHEADLVLHSGTKILAGHHDALLGVLTARSDEVLERLRSFRSASGLVAAPDPAWLLLRGLKTLGLRAERQSASALELARRLAVHPAVSVVRYPGLGPDPVAAMYVSAFGPLLSFDVRDGEAAVSVERGLSLIENATSLGGVASTLEARARWEGSNVPAGLLRLSVGLEAVEDLWADLRRPLDRVA